MKSILLGLGDITFSASATDHAVELATKHSATICAVTTFDPASLNTGAAPIGAGSVARELRDQRKEETKDALDQAVRYFQKTAKKAGVEFEVVREAGDPFEQLISRSRYSDLIICGLRNLFAGNLDAPPHELFRLVEEGVRPMIAVSNQYREIKKVLIAYSGSTESAKTMRRFAQQKLWPDAQLRIVTFDQDEAAGQQRLADAQKYFASHGLDVEVEVVAQSARDSLLSYASGWDADMIVLGNSAKRLLLRKIFGETALHVLANSDRPLYLCQ